MSDENKEIQETETKAEKPAKKHMSAAMQKKLRYGGVATAITCVVVAIVVVLNVLVSRMVDKYPLKIDLTESHMYEISQDSIDFLENMEQDVEFTVLMAESNFQGTGASMKMVAEMLERYAQYSDKIHLSYVDPATNPDVVNAYQENYSASLQEGDIVVALQEDKSKMRVVNINTLFTYDQQKYYALMYSGQGSLENCITGFTGEQNLTAALMYVTDADPIRIGVFAKANGSSIFNPVRAYSMAVFSQTLTKNGYDVETLDLYTDTLNAEDYDVLILPAPVNDLTEAGIEKLTNFLYNDGAYGKDLIYIADVTQGATPRIDEFLASWGLEVGSEGYLTEGDSNAALQATLASVNAAGAASAVPTYDTPKAEIDNQDYAAGVSNTSLPIAVPYCRPVRLLWDSKTAGVTASLLKTSDTVRLNATDSDDADGEVKTEETDAQTVMALSARKTSVNNESVESDIMVLGSLLIPDYYLMQDNSYNNSQYLVSAVNTMTGKGSGLIITEKTLTDQTLTMTAGDVRGSVIAVFAVPLIVIIVGIVVIARRRNK